MTPEPSPTPIPDPAGPKSPSRKGRCLLYGCGSLLAVLILIVGTVALTLWWIQRPIKPVVLTADEKAVVDEKVRFLHASYSRSTSSAGDGSSAASSGGSVRQGIKKAAPNQPNSLAGGADARSKPDSSGLDKKFSPITGPGLPYLPGSKILKLTDREINGLLNANTDLGERVHLDFTKDAVNAYLAIPIPQDFPVGGGRIFRARGRFSVSVGNGGEPFAVLQDITVFGLSLPNAWLGGVKGQNLLANALSQDGQPAAFRGIKRLRIEPGALVLELAE